LIEGIAGAYLDIIAAGAQMIADVITGIGQAAEDIVTAGANAIISFLEGVASNVLLVIDAGFQIVIDFLNGLADSIESNRGELAKAGFNLLDAIFGGVLSKAVEVFAWFAALPGAIVTAIGNVLETLAAVGNNLISGLWNGIVTRVVSVATWFAGIGATIVTWIGNAAEALVGVGKDLIVGLWNGIYDKFINWMKDKLGWLWDLIPGWIKDALGISSPSKVFMEIGKWIPIGLGIGILNEQNVIRDAMLDLGSTVTDSFVIDEKDLTAPAVNAMHSLAEALSISSDFNPTITPVLDLTQVARDAKLLKNLYPDLSTSTASNISAAELEASAISQEFGAEAGVNVQFVQNNNSPKALSTNDIYRQTKNQIAIAKEELSIR
jgi:hypothetical protein